MRNVPAEVMASWPEPNYVDPVTRGPLLFIVNSLFLFLATIAVSIRLYTRIGIRKWFGVDDWFIVFAYVSGATIAGFPMPEKVLTAVQDPEYRCCLRCVLCERPPGLEQAYLGRPLVRCYTYVHHFSRPAFFV